MFSDAFGPRWSGYAPSLQAVSAIRRPSTIADSPFVLGSASDRTARQDKRISVASTAGQPFSMVHERSSVMANKVSRWNGDTPLTKAHGGTKAAALLAIKESQRISRADVRLDPRLAAVRDAQRYAEWEAKGKPPSPTQPRLDRLRPRKGRYALRDKLFTAQRGYCGICGFAMYAVNGATIDHVIPRALGGKDAGNVLLAHGACNNEKADRLPTQRQVDFLKAVNARLASVDTHPQGGDGEAAPAPLSSAVPNGETPQRCIP